MQREREREGIYLTSEFVKWFTRNILVQELLNSNFLKKSKSDNILKINTFQEWEMSTHKKIHKQKIIKIK